MPDPKPLRDGDTLGRAGRVSKKGNPIEVERNRAVTDADTRRTTVEVIGFDHPRLVVTEQAPFVDTKGEPLPVVQQDEHQTLMNLDGKGEVRPPRSWEEMEAARRAEIGAREREVHARSLKRERAALKLGERVARLQQRALVMQSQRAVQVRETDARGAEDRDRARSGTRARSRSRRTGGRSSCSSRRSRVTGTRMTVSRSGTCSL
jgi:hypothetical protein